MHRLLNKQLHRFLGKDFLPDGQWERLFNAIDDYYFSMEGDNNLLSNALKHNSDELTRVNRLLQEQVNAGDALIHQLLDSIPVPICVKSRQGEYLKCNKSFAEYMGKSEAEILARYEADFSPPEIVNQHELAEQEVLQNNRPTLHEEWMLDRNNHRICIETLRTPHLDIDGNVIGLIQISRNITVKKNATELDSMRSSILELISMGDSLSHIMEKIVQKIELHDPRVTGCIRLLNDTATHFSNNYGCTLAEPWAAELCRSKLTDQTCACNRAVTRNNTVILNELGASNSPLCHLAAQRGFVGCWSEPIRISSGQVVGVITTYHKRAITPNPSDINILKDATSLAGIAIEHARSEENLRIAAATFESNNGVLVTDADANILQVNKAFVEITGYTPSEVIGKNPRIFSSGRHNTAFYDQMWESILCNGSWTGEIWDRRKNGEVYPKWTTISAIQNTQGQISKYVAIFSDITEKKRVEDEVRSLAFYDPLTQLPNRRMLLDHVRGALSSAARSKLYGAIMFLDLDRFKVLNDTLGHQYGDMLLIEVAKRIKQCVRDIDMVARLGGDEFVVLVEGLGETIEFAATKAMQIAEKIRESLAASYQLSEHVHHSSPSIGLTLFHDHSETVDELLKHADVAMYNAKSDGRNTVRLFDITMQNLVDKRGMLEKEMREALINEQFELYYQVQINCSGKPVGAEALIRWMHPERGMISPADFIPVAEESMMILDIGHWVLIHACKRLQEWAKDERTEKLSLAINVSALQFKMPNFVNTVAHALQTHNVNPKRLKLELTESVVVGDLQGVVNKMQELKALGIILSLDDFGTGYSSLSYLKRLPLDQLKIDQSFIRNLHSDSSDAIMVQTIISMANNFKMDVIAEGVENETQLSFLRSNGCRTYQGYHYSKPVPLDIFIKLVSNLGVEPDYSI